MSYWKKRERRGKKRQIDRQRQMKGITIGEKTGTYFQTYIDLFIILFFSGWILRKTNL